MKRTVLFMVAVVALVMAACSTDTKTVVPKKPVVTEQPEGLMCGQGDTVLLQVTATSKDKKAKLTYQWYSNTKNSAKGGAKITDAGASGTLVSGEKGGNFEPPTNEIGVFYYYVEVVSTLGKEKAKVTSDVAVITVVDAAEMPVISASNGDPTATGGGDDIVLSVTLPDSIDELLESDEDLEALYQWYSNTRNSNSGGTLIPTATASVFQPPTDIEGTMYYYVIITVKNKNTGEVVKTTTSIPMRVTVITKVGENKGIDAPTPLITTQPRGVPASTPYYVGKPITPLTVVASITELEGIPNIVTYQWYRNATSSNNGGELIEGAEDDTYTPPNNEAYLAYFYVVITNTIQDNGDGGDKSKSAYSNAARIEVKKGIDAATPVINTQPENKSFTLAQNPTALSVVATVADEGDVTYQWYKKLSDNPLEAGDPIDGETRSSYTPSTEHQGLSYFYVKITNRIDDNGDGGKKTVSVNSDTVFVAVGMVVLNLNVPITTRQYNGNTTATWGTGVTFTNMANNQVLQLSDLVQTTLVQGTATFAQADAGVNIPVTLEGWYLTGSGKDNYFLRVPNNITGTITKATGSTVSQPAAAGAVPGHFITVNPVTLTNPDWGQGIEYARSTAANTAANLLTWQEGTTFDGLNCTTNYYIYARSTEIANYAAGTPTVSAVIATGNPSVIFETNGGTALDFYTIPKGNAAGQPALNATTRDGFTLDYWYTNTALTAPYNFRAAVNENITLYARWISNAVINQMRDDKEMEWIRGGGFTMGSPAGEAGRVETNTYKVETQRWVVLSGYFMGKYEITQEKWQAIMGGNPSYFTSGIEAGTPQKLPVEQVNWYEALVFCNRLSVVDGLSPAYNINGSTNTSLWGSIPTSDSVTWNGVSIVAGANGYRLPTEAEWEYACRAGTETPYNNGTAAMNANTGWYPANSGNQTHRVGLKDANAWGLYDMHGNVSEWVMDAFAYSPNSIPAVSINPINTTASSQPPPSSFEGIYYDESVQPSTGQYVEYQYTLWGYPQIISAYYVFSYANRSIPTNAVGKGAPAQPYLRMITIPKQTEIGAYWNSATVSTLVYKNSYDDNYRFDYSKAIPVFGNYYALWKARSDPSVQNARIVRGGGFNWDARVMRSASRTSTAWEDPPVAADLPTLSNITYTQASNAYVDAFNGSNDAWEVADRYKTYGRCTTLSEHKKNNIGLRVVRLLP